MCIAALIPQTMAEARHNIDPNYPWAEDHFQDSSPAACLPTPAHNT